jgi:hypothetical protein
MGVARRNPARPAAKSSYSDRASGRIRTRTASGPITRCSAFIAPAGRSQGIPTAKACRYEVGIETNQDERDRRVFVKRMSLLTDQFGGTAHGGGRVLHSIIHRELQVFGSSRGDGDSSWCRASSFACGANCGRDRPGSCRRSLPRKAVYLRQFSTFAIREMSSRCIPDLALRTTRSGGRLRADANTGQICVTCAAADESTAHDST